MTEDYDLVEELGDKEKLINDENNIEGMIVEEIPENVYSPIMENVPQSLLIEARDKVFELNPMIKRTPEMNNIVSHIIFHFYVENKRYVIVEAPTGSGKSVIGYLVYMISKYCYNKINGKKPVITITDDNGKEIEVLNRGGEDFPTYYLTSSKALQEQIEYDIKRFGFEPHMGMLKGASNYLCTRETKDKGVNIYYNERYCVGFSKIELQLLSCFDSCPYKTQRQYVANKNVAVLNYAFFLNTTKSKFRPLFKVRELTIADECHLVPEAVLNCFNYEFTQWLLNKFEKNYQNILYNFKEKLDEKLLDEINTIKAKCFLFYSKPLNHIDYVLEYYNDMINLLRNFSKLKINIQLNYEIPFKEMGIRKETEKIIEKMEEFAVGKPNIEELCNRQDDIYFTSEIINTNSFMNTKIYKHVLKDMAENVMTRKHFIDNTQRCLMMSATVGNSEEFAKMMGLEPDEYCSIILNSNFDFTESPIYLCRSGKLNYAQYNQNIDKCLMDCIKIAEEYHPKDKGIIHTSTNINTRKLRERIMYCVPNFNRYLFYDTSEEKERCIEKMKNDASVPYVMVGPSLYEGIDLKDDFGRFNILLKVPYSQFDEYAKKKSLRFGFWYERVAIERTVQAIGRTNRNPKDWSVTYLIDSCFENIIWKCGTEKTIKSRIKSFTVR